MKLSLQRLAVIFLLSSCKSRNSSDVKIQGADPTAKVNQSVVQIFNGKNLEPHCTGSIIAENVIATAAHCIASESTGETHDPAVIMNGKLFYPSEAVIPKKYLTATSDQRGAHDFGLMVFSESISSEFVEIYERPLPEKLDDVEVIGYGGNATFKAHVFRDKSIERLVNSLRIQWSHRFSMWLHPGKYMIYGDNTYRKFDYGLPISILVNLNGGDSGGPALLRNKLIGVASRGENTDGFGLSSEYCAIAPGSLHYKWLRDYIAGKPVTHVEKITFAPKNPDYWSARSLEQITKDQFLLDEKYEEIREKILKEYQEKFTIPAK